MGVVDTVEAEVRELVRRRGVDPVVGRAAMRLLVDEAVAEYEDRSLTSSLPPLADSRQAAKSVWTPSPSTHRSSDTWTARRWRRSGSTSG